MANTSKQIDIVQLDKELGSKGLITNFEDELNKLILPVDGSDVTEEQLEMAISAHIPAVPVDTATAKAALLAKLGITAEEAQLLLGGN